LLFWRRFQSPSSCFPPRHLFSSPLVDPGRLRSCSYAFPSLPFLPGPNLLSPSSPPSYHRSREQPFSGSDGLALSALPPRVLITFLTGSRAPIFISFLLQQACTPHGCSPHERLCLPVPNQAGFVRFSPSVCRWRIFFKILVGPPGFLLRSKTVSSLCVFLFFFFLPQRRVPFLRNTNRPPWVTGRVEVFLLFEHVS